MIKGHPQIEYLPVGKLRLDPENPRLPDEAHKWPQSRILAHLRATETLEELAHSMAAEGFFPNEPLTVLRRKNPNEYIVLEGNRRAATLMILLRLDAAGEEEFFDLKLNPKQRERLQEIPCLVVDSRDKVDSFIGFRHIGGLKTWSPEAKARWIVQEVEKAAHGGSENPFLDVGRRVGQYQPTIRDSYLALQVLRRARDEGGVEIGEIIDPRAQRFGVWLRCLASPEIREQMGLRPESGASYKEVVAAIKKIKPNKVGEIISDLLPRDGQSAVLRDSRNVTTYGRILANDRARKTLRTTGDLEVAKQVIGDVDLSTRIRKQTHQLDVLRQELSRAETITEALAESIEELFSVARQMRSLARESKGD